MNPRLGITIAIGGLALTLLACGPRALATSRSAAVVIGTTDRLTDLDPATSYDFHTWELHNATMGGLVMYTPQGVAEPVLAESLPTRSEDGLTWTVKLRQGLRFASGRELRAEDVVWSIERVRNLHGKSSWFVTSFLDGVKALDEYSVEFSLQQPTSFFTSLLAVPAYFPLDQTCYPADEIDGESTCGGLGRYLIKEWIRDDRVVLEANPAWPGARPATSRVVIRYIDDAEAMRRELERGGIDIAWNTLTPSAVAELRQTEGIRVWEGPSSFKRMLVFAHTTEPFGDPRVRQAFSYIIDRAEIAERAFQGTFTPLYSPIPNASPTHIDTLPHTDVEKGVELLAQAGVTAENPLAFDLWWTSDHYGDKEGELAAMIEEQLEATGTMAVEIKSSKWSTYVERTSECDYPAYLLGWYPDYLDPSTSIDFFAFSQATPDLCSNYANPEMDALIRSAQSATVPTAREELYKQIQRIWAIDLPTIPLVQGLQVAASHEEVAGVSIDASGMLRYEMLSKL